MFTPERLSNNTQGVSTQTFCFKISPYHGVPTLFIDGVPNTGLMFMPVGWKGGSAVHQFAAAGVHLYNAGPSPISLIDGNWKFDYASMEAVAESLLRADPEGWFLPRIGIPTPPGWLEEHPDDTLTYFDGIETKTEIANESIKCQKQGSISSQAWREVASTELTRFIQWLERTPFGQRTIGYHVCWGQYGEWVHPSTYSPLLADYSPAETKAFRRFLKDRYGNDASLRSAWQNREVSLETASIPSPVRRIEHGMSLFRDPRTDMDLIDFYTFRAFSVADALNFFAHVVKEATNRRKLFAAFYGYLLGAAWHHNLLLESGHLALRKVLSCPDVDILAAPSTYVMRGVGTGTSLLPSTIESITMTGKLWLDENDVRTHSGHQCGFGWTDTVEQTIQVQRRHLACTFAHGNACWWMEQNADWYADEKTMSEIARLVSVGHRVLDADRSSMAEIAFVVDALGMAGIELISDLPWAVLEGMDTELSRIGAPVDRILLDDLDKARDYKFYIIANAFFLDDEKRVLLDRYLKCNGKMVLWLYAPGYFNNFIGNAGNITSLTGMLVQQAMGHYVWLARTCPAAPVGVSADFLFGSDRRVAPFFWITDPNAEVLAISEDNAHPIFAVKELDKWTSAYSVCVPIPAVIMRYLARRAGVHIWWEGEGCFFANRSFFAIHSRNGGRQEVKLPRPCKVLDLLDNRPMITNRDTLNFEMSPGTTRMFLLT